MSLIVLPVLCAVETIDWTGGQIANDDSADDVKNVDLTQVRTSGSTSGSTVRFITRCYLIAVRLFTSGHM